ncbi:hypothetical protein PBY51_009376 [Eleginops maclovinus]|uniref:Uncharacterized protein n=1 Tax=Eleginops maclovinus TaxID=56733 RepID=A0AAN7XWW8_ELEMC|nr:hypothetical protein PBY51_009376 [Eleginops maclovinus]
MYLYKATCPDIPNPKQKGSRSQGGGQGVVQNQGPGQERLSRQASTVMRPYTPLMLWTQKKNNAVAQLKQLEEFLNFHTLSLHDTVKSQTGMVYR